MSKKTEEEAGLLADRLGYTGQRKQDFVQGYIKDPLGRYGRSALRKKSVRDDMILVRKLLRRGG